MIETWKTKINMGQKQAFDSVNHELLIAILKCYGQDQDAFEIFRSYLSNRYQCCKINNILEECRKIIVGVPQRSILRFLLFNTVLNDIIFFLKTLVLVTMQTITLCILAMKI